MNRVLGSNKAIYIIAGILLIIQGLCSTNQVTDGVLITSYATQTWYATGLQTGWGIAMIIAGLLSFGGFIVMSVGAFLRKNICVAIGGAIVCLSYVCAVIREALYASVFGSFGFIILNIFCLAIMVAVTLTAIDKIKVLNDFMIRHNIIALIIPAVLLVVTLIVAAAQGGMGGRTVIYNTVETLGQIAAIIVASTLILKINEPVGGEQMENKTNNSFNMNNSVQAPDGYRSVALVIIFSFITFGIYTIYWVYKMSDKLNKELDTGKSSGIQTLLYALVPFYSWYWYYTQTEKLNIYARMKDRTADDGLPIVNLILCIFGLAIVSVGLMQDEMNRCVGDSEGDNFQKVGAQNFNNNYNYGGYAYAQPQAKAQPEPQTQDIPKAPVSDPEPTVVEANVAEEEPTIVVANEEPTVALNTDDAETEALISNLQAELRGDLDTYSDPLEEFMGAAEETEASAEEVAPVVEEVAPVEEAPAEEYQVPYEQLRRLKELLDDEIITQDEFDQLKQKFIK